MGDGAMTVLDAGVASADPGPGESHPRAGRLPYLDGWRAVAIGGVLFDHFVTSKGFNTGRLGVELFFVLSGRLMAQILFVEQAGLRSFYYRRFARVWPTIAVMVILLLAASKALHKDWVYPSGALEGLTYTYNYMAAAGHRLPMLDHLWSLCIEEHSYIFLGLLALLVRRFPGLLWPALGLTILANMLDGAISTYLLKQDYFQAYWRTDVRMASILLGVAAFLAKRQGRLRLAGPWPVVLLIAGWCLNIGFVPDPIKYSLGSLCLALAVANIDLDGLGVKRALSHPIMVWVGLISFSLYVWQQPFAAVTPHSATDGVALFAAALIAALGSFYVVEGPARRWLNGHPPRWATDVVH
jgi:peptidoglycan/LPS O-acetylase OafA/YrhL